MEPVKINHKDEVVLASAFKVLEDRSSSFDYSYYCNKLGFKIRILKEYNKDCLLYCVSLNTSFDGTRGTYYFYDDGSLCYDNMRKTTIKLETVVESVVNYVEKTIDFS